MPRPDRAQRPVPALSLVWRRRSTLAALAALLVAALGACSDEGGEQGSPDQDAAPDDVTDVADVTDVTDDAPSDADAGSEDAADVDTDMREDAPDAQPPPSPLPVVWEAPLELCPRRSRVLPLAQSEASKLKVVLSPAPRPVLDEAALSADMIDTLRVARSPFAADQTLVTGDAVVTSVARYERQGAPLDDPLYLLIKLRHDLGDAGALLETISVERTAGDALAPVVVDGDREGEVWFDYVAPGAVEATALEPCEGSASKPTRIDVLLAEHEDTGLRAALVRRVEGLGPQTTGVEPARVLDAVLYLSDRPYTPFVIDGPWALTFAKSGDGRYEHTAYDLTRDPFWYHALFAPLARGEAPAVTRGAAMPAKVTIEALGSTLPLIEVTMADVATGQHATRRWDMSQTFVRIDDEALRAYQAAACPRAWVETIGFGLTGGYHFQAVFCPGEAEGDPPQLLSITPVVFAEDLSLVGQRFEGAAQISSALVADAPGFVVELGAWRLGIAPDVSPGRDHLELVDPEGEIAVQGTTARGTLSLDGHPSHVFEAASAQGDVQVRVTRVEGAQTSDNAVYAPGSLALTFGGVTHRVMAWDRLRYVNTPDNASDEMIAETDTLRLRWRVEPIEGTTQRRFLVSAETLNGTPVLPEVEVSSR